MKEIISIKGNQHGLTVDLDETVDFDTLVKTFESKLKAGRKFFGANKVTLQFTNRQLVAIEETRLVECISKVTDMEVICIVNESNEYNQVKEDVYLKIKNEIEESLSAKVTNKLKTEYEVIISNLNSQINKLNNEIQSKTSTSSIEALLPDDCAIFHPQTLRSGQQVSTKNSVIVLGDVNNGSRVEAGGSVIVIGKLKGVVHAGLNRNKSIIIALDMNPVQLRIGEAYGRSETNETQVGSKYEPKVAFAKDGRIFIEPIDNKIYKDLRLLKKI